MLGTAALHLSPDRQKLGSPKTGIAKNWDRQELGSPICNRLFTPPPCTLAPIAKNWDRQKLGGPICDRLIPLGCSLAQID